MIKLGEEERKYITEFLDCLKKFRNRVVVARDKLYNTVLSYEENTKNGKKFEIIENVNGHVGILNDEAVPLRKEEISWMNSNIAVCDMFMEELEESLSDDWDMEKYFLNVGNFSKSLKAIVDMMKFDKKFFGVKKLRVDIIILHLIEKDIIKGLIEELSDNYNKALESREFMLNLKRGVLEQQKGKTLANEDAIYIIENASDSEYIEFVNADFEYSFKMVKSYVILKEYYFDKKDSYTLEDLKFIIEAFDNLEIDKEISGMIINRLKKGINNRDKNVVIRPVKREVSNIRKFNDINRDLLKYYNLDKKEIVIDRYITSSEVIYCVTLLNELKANKGDIETFMGEVNRVNRVRRKDLSHIFFTSEAEASKELSLYYNVDNNEIVINKYLIKEEIIKCIIIMNYLKYDNSIKERFLVSVKEFNEIKERDDLVLDVDAMYPVQVYEDLYKKIDFYSTYFGFSKELEDGLKTTYELCLVTDLNTLEDCADYYSYQDVLSSELDTVLKYMRPDNMVEYELNKALERGSKLNVKKRKK